MSQERKERWFHIAQWSAAGLYLWGLILIWMAPEWGLSGWMFYLLGVFPAALGVFAMSAALGLYMDLRDEGGSGGGPHEGGEALPNS